MHTFGKDREKKQQEKAAAAKRAADLKQLEDERKRKEQEAATAAAAAAAAAATASSTSPSTGSPDTQAAAATAPSAATANSDPELTAPAESEVKASSSTPPATGISTEAEAPAPAAAVSVAVPSAASAPLVAASSPVADAVLASTSIPAAPAASPSKGGFSIRSLFSSIYTPSAAPAQAATVTSPAPTAQTAPVSLTTGPAASVPTSSGSADTSTLLDTPTAPVAANLTSPAASSSAAAPAFLEAKPVVQPSVVISAKETSLVAPRKPGVDEESLLRGAVVQNAKHKNALLKSIAAGNFKFAYSLADNKEALTQPDSEGEVAIHYAAAKGNEDFVQALIQKGASANAVNHYGESAVHTAVRNNHTKVVHALATVKGIKLSTQTSDKGGYHKETGASTPVHYLFYKGEFLNVQLLDFFVESMANLSAANSHNETALYLAMQHPRANDIKTPKTQSALYQATNVDVVTKDKKTVLHAAAANKHLSLDWFQGILNWSENKLIDKQDNELNTPLFYAIQNQDRVKIDALMAHKANPNVWNKKISPLHLALRNNDTTTAYGLIDLHADVNAKDVDGRYPIHYVLRPENILVLGKLLAAKADVNQKDPEGKAPIHLAVALGNLSALSQLLTPRPDTAKIDVNAKDADGKTAFHYAVTQGNIDALKMLVAAKATIKDDMKKWAVETALLANNAALLLFLVNDLRASAEVHITLPRPKGASTSSSLFSTASSIESAVDPRFQNKWLQEGDTPLHYAVRHGHEDLAVACVKNHPLLVNATNKAGKTPAAIAIKVLNPGMARFLEHHGAKDLVGNTSFDRQAATRGFGDVRHLTEFFMKPDFKLSAEQETLKTDVYDSKYKAPSLK